MRAWFHNVLVAIQTVAQGMYITLWYFLQTYRRKTFTQHFEYPELPVPVKPRYRGFHRFDLTTCIGCDKCARACPVDCIYIEKIKNPVGKGFRVNGFKIDYTKCMFCALCVDPCPVDCIFMGSTLRSELFQPRRLHRRFRQAAGGDGLGPGDAQPDRGCRLQAPGRAGLDQAARPGAGRRRNEPLRLAQCRERRMLVNRQRRFYNKDRTGTIPASCCGWEALIFPFGQSQRCTVQREEDERWSHPRRRNCSPWPRPTARLPLVRVIVRDITRSGPRAARTPRATESAEARRSRPAQRRPRRGTSTKSRRSWNAARSRWKTTSASCSNSASS